MAATTTILDAAALGAALRDLSTRCLGGANASLTAFNALTESHLASLDQTTLLVDAARQDTQHATDVAFAELMAQTRVRGGGVGLWGGAVPLRFGVLPRAAAQPPAQRTPLPPPLPPSPKHTTAGSHRPVCSD